MPLLALRVGHDLLAATHEQREEAHAVGVIGDDEEVERTRQLDRLAAGRLDLVALGEDVGVTRREPCAKRAGVHGKRRVQVRVAEVGAGGEVAPGVGGVERPAGKGFLGLGLVQLPGIAFGSRHGQGHQAGGERDDRADGGAQADPAIFIPGGCAMAVSALH